MSLPRAALLGVLLFVVALSAQSQSDLSRSGQWRIAGQNLNNTWSQPAEHSISPANVKELKPKWVFTTGGDVSATPTVDGDAVYLLPRLGRQSLRGPEGQRSPHLVSQDLRIRWRPKERSLALALPWMQTT